ncbi:MAG: hypothetical protein AB1558_03420 [Thermodesulfobacteriota bacterium]
MIDRRWVLWSALLGLFFNFIVPILSHEIAFSLLGMSSWSGTFSATIEVISKTGDILIIIALVLWAIVFWRKQSSKRHSVLFLLFSLAGYVLCDVGFGVYAQIKAENISIYPSLIEKLYDRATQPLGTIMMMAPFLFLGGISASFAQKNRIPIAISLFLITFSVLGYMYFLGHMHYEMHILEKKWTAASLSLGLLPFKGMFVISVLFIITHMFFKNKANDNHTVKKDV